MSLSGLFGALSGMDGMTACSVSMMCRLLPTVASLLLWTLLEVKRTCREHRERADLTKNDISAPTAAARLVALPISCWVMRLVKPEIAAAWKAYCG